jgi:hypothetical protein
LPHSHFGKGLSAVCSAARWIEEDEWRGEVPGMGSAEPRSDSAGGIRWHVTWVLLGDVGTEVVDMVWCEAFAKVSVHDDSSLGTHCIMRIPHISAQWLRARWSDFAWALSENITVE